MIRALGITPSKLDQEPKTVAARAELSDSECRSLEMVKPPRENACSTSVEVANEGNRQLKRNEGMKLISKYLPGIDIKSRAIAAKGWPAACIPAQ